VPYLSALEVCSDEALYESTFAFTFTFRTDGASMAERPQRRRMVVITADVYIIIVIRVIVYHCQKR